MGESLRLRWLGVAGIELTLGGEILAIDPFFSRFPFWRMWLAAVRPDPALSAVHLPRCDFALVSHAHWDHLMDVPDVVRHTGALALGSGNACELLRCLGAPAERVRQIAAGDRLTLGGYEVEVLPGGHDTALGRPIFAGPLSPGLRPPLRARDYRMDCCFSFLVRAGELRFLVWNGGSAALAPRADVLFVGVYRPRAIFGPLLAAVRPRIVVPIHWDDLFRPLSQPLRPMLAPPGLAWPPLRRMDPGGFRRTVEGLAPGTMTLVPEMFRAYDIGDLSWELERTFAPAGHQNAPVSAKE